LLPFAFKMFRQRKIQLMKEFLKPDWRKVLLFAVFALIAVGGHIQAWAFSDVPPKPPLYDLLRPFPLWPMWVELLFPLIILSLPLRIVGLDVMAGHFLLFVAANVLYFYFLSCLLVVSFDRYRNRFPKWLCAVIIVLPLALSLPGLIVTLEMIPYFLGSLLIASLYLHLLSCLGFFVYDAFRRRSIQHGSK